jgi:hypothetical protein
MTARARRARGAPGPRRDSISDAVLKSFVTGAVAIAIFVVTKLAGLDARAAGTAGLAVSIVGAGYVVHGAVAPKLRRAGSVALAALVLAAAAVPVARTLWPGSSLAAGALREAGDELTAPPAGERAIWVLVASSVGHEHAAWWGEYELRVGDLTVKSELGRVPARGWRRDGLRFRPPTVENRARYHRVRLREPLTRVRLESLVGEVPGGLEVAVFRAPFAEWFAIAVWLCGFLVVTAVDVRWGCKGALGLAATIPLLVSALVWRYVTPAAPLEEAFRAVIAGTFIGSFVGYGVARVAAVATVRLRSRARRA